MVKDTEPLLELDRDEKKFEIFLSFHRSSLLVSDLKIFLPFTINLDPYLKKVIKGNMTKYLINNLLILNIYILEETQGLEEDGIVLNSSRSLGMMSSHGMQQSMQMNNDWTTPRINQRRRVIQRISPNNQSNSNVVYPPVPLGWQHWTDPMIMQQAPLPIAPVTIMEVSSKSSITLVQVFL